MALIYADLVRAEKKPILDLLSARPRRTLEIVYNVDNNPRRVRELLEEMVRKGKITKSVIQKGHKRGYLWSLSCS